MLLLLLLLHLGGERDVDSCNVQFCVSLIGQPPLTVQLACTSNLSKLGIDQMRELCKRCVEEAQLPATSSDTQQSHTEQPKHHSGLLIHCEVTRNSTRWGTVGHTVGHTVVQCESR